MEPEGVQEADGLTTGSAGSLRPAQGALTEISIIDIIVVVDIQLIDAYYSAILTYSAGAFCAGDGVVENVEADGTRDEVLHAFIVYD